MWTDSLKHFHFWCQKTLPLVYDDSLSYYEVLAKLTKHLNELTTLVNEIGDELERYEGVTDNRLDTLETWRTEVDTWRAQIDEWKTDVNTWIEQTDDWKQSTENHLTAHDNWISYATGLINNTIMPFIEDMTTRVGDIENRLSGAEDDIDTLQSDVTSLDGRLDDAESAITGLDSRLDTAEDDIDTLQSDVTSLDGRLDTAEDDIDNLENSMSTAESTITELADRFVIITGMVNFDSTNNIWKLDLNKSKDKDYLISKINNVNYLQTAVSNNTIFIFTFLSSGYNYEELVISYNGTPLQYNGQNVYIDIGTPGSASSWYYDFRSVNGDLYVLYTRPATNVQINRLIGCDILNLPIPDTTYDDGKVVAYNNATKKYELITPSGGSSHTYSTTEHEVGTWINGKTVYEKVISATVSSGNITCYIGLTPTDVIQCVARAKRNTSTVTTYWNYNLRVEWQGDSVVVTSPDATFNFTAEVIIRYTKT